MNNDVIPQSPPSRLFNLLLRALDPGEEVCVESELLKHFPFARLGEPTPQPAAFRVASTAPGAL